MYINRQYFMCVTENSLNVYIMIRRHIIFTMTTFIPIFQIKNNTLYCTKNLYCEVRLMVFI